MNAAASCERVQAAMIGRGDWPLSQRRPQFSQTYFSVE